MSKFLVSLIFISSSYLSFGQVLTADQFQQAINPETNVKILDIRSHEIFVKGHIKNAINLDYDKDDFERLLDQYFNKENTILIYGGSDYMTNNAVVFFRDLGYQKIKSLKGGFAEWIAASKPYKTDQYTGPLASFTPANFESMKSRYDKLLVFLETPSCAYCIKMKPFLSKTASANGVKVLRIDIAQNENMSYFFEASGTPTVILFDQQKQVWKGNSFMNPQELDSILKRYF